MVAGSCSPQRTKPAISFKDTTFEYIKGSNGRVLIKVSPEFMIKIMSIGKENGNEQVMGNSPSSFLCSTPELKKHYHMLIGSKGQMWSPKLDTISECVEVVQRCGSCPIVLGIWIASLPFGSTTIV
ncbi:hypothetical protein ACET3Z_001788 [Daucus carota]